MERRIAVGIAGTGSYVPERVVDNEWFTQFVDTSDEWIRQRTGIIERRFVADGEMTSDMCLRAAQRALEASGTDAAELDQIIVATLTPDQFLPACAPLVQKGLGARKAGAVDLNAACSGFVSAINFGEGLVAAGRARKVLVIGAETLSAFLDKSDRGSCILFGDGAGAVVLAPHEECAQGEILKTQMGADGDGYEFIQMIAGGTRKPLSHATIDAGEPFIRVKGREVYKFAVMRMGELIGDMLEGRDLAELGLIVPHQVNQRIIESAVERFDIPAEKVMVNIHKYGNTSAASVAIALDEAMREGRLEKGKLVVLAAFGAGLTWAATLLRW